jgi:hypothetical protein
MTHPTISIGRRPPSGTTRPPVGHSIGFDWIMVALGGWLLGGLYVDGWAHNHLATTLESFFTPWHAAFYSGFMAVAGVMALREAKVEVLEATLRRSHNWGPAEVFHRRDGDDAEAASGTGPSSGRCSR